jgi:hypothetical protein
LAAEGVEVVVEKAVLEEAVEGEVEGAEAEEGVLEEEAVVEALGDSLVNSNYYSFNV